MQQLFIPLIVQIPSGTDPQSASWTTLSQQSQLSELTSEHPNVTWINQAGESLSIEDVRAVQELLGYSSYQQQVRLIVLLNADTASLPAQNALLKMLEEPPINTQLALVVTQPEVLLPTVLSRCLIVSVQGQPTPEAVPKIPEQLLTLLTEPDSVAHHQLIQLSEQYGGERGEAIQLLEHLLKTGHSQLRQTPDNSKTPQQLQALLRGIRWLKSNVQVKLALAECFFSLKSIS
jgi:hypothetical protein